MLGASILLPFSGRVTARYDGVIAFEAFSSSTCSPTVAGKAAIWRSVFEDGEDVARRALDYLKAGMASAQRAMELARSV
jgi:D-psicose/D-tagatose/L-ribulose 3-epimerase